MEVVQVRAEDDRPVVADREAKSVSQEETFARDLTDLAVLGREIDAMAGRVAGRLRSSSWSGRTVTLKLRRYDFTTPYADVAGDARRGGRVDGDYWIDRRARVHVIAEAAQPSRAFARDLDPQFSIRFLGEATF